MQKKDCFNLGHVSKAYSFKGEVILLLDSDNPKHYHKLESVFVEINKLLVPFFITECSVHNKPEFLRVKFEGVDSEQKAKNLIGKELYLPLHMLPKLPKGEFYIHDLIGFEILENNSRIGEVKEIYDLPNNRMFEVEYLGRDVLIPYRDEVVKSIDGSEKQIHVTLPEGLLDVYFSNTSSDDDDDAPEDSF